MDEKAKREKEERELKYARTIITIGTVIVLLVAVLILLLVIVYAKPVNASADAVPEVEEEALLSLEDLETADVGEVVYKMSSMEQSRADYISESESIEASIAASIEMSIEMSIAYEQSSIAQSEYESSYQSSVEEASSIAEWEALCAPVAGSHLIPGQVVTNCDDSDIPYLRKLFSNCIVVGNSRAKNAVDCGIMTEKEVIYVSGQPAEAFGDPVSQGASLFKPKAVLILGLNDLGYYKSDSYAFKEDYAKLIDLYYSINPNSTLYLQEILPVPDEAAPYFWRYKEIPNFCARIQELAEEKNCVYLSKTSEYADFSLINSEDHAHYGKEYYFLWAQCIANELHLWELLAGFNYEYPY